MLGQGIYGYLGLVFGVLRHLQIVQGNRAVIVEILGTLELSPGEDLIRDGHSVVRIAARDVVTSNGQHQLTFLNRVAEPCVNAHDAPGGERNDRDVAGYVGSDRPRDDQLGGGGMFGRRGQRKLLRTIHGEESGVRKGNDFGVGGRPLRRIRFRSSATIKDEK